MRELTTFLIDDTVVKYFLPKGEDLQTVIADARSMNTFLKKFIHPDSVCVDIGARDGDSLLPLFPILAKGKGRIVAIEPNPEEFPFIEKNLEKNGHENKSLYNLAISDKTGEQKFLWDKEGRNGGLETPQIKIGDWKEERTFYCSAFEDLGLKLQNELRQAHFIKTDTEGSDITVLEELSDIINENRPFIMMEWWPRTEERMVKFVNDYAYAVVDPKTSKILRTLDLQKRTHDLFLIPREKLLAFVTSV